MIGDRLREIREQQGLSREKLARRVDIGSQQIYRYENNEQIPLSDVVARIAQALNISTDYLLGLTDDPTPHTVGNKLTPTEAAIIAAFRRGDRLEAIKFIIVDE